MAEQERLQVILEVIAKNTEALNRINERLQSIGKATKTTASSIGGLAGNFRRLAWTVVRLEILLRGFNRIIQLIGRTFNFAINSVEKYRRAVIGLAAIRTMLAGPIGSLQKVYEAEKNALDDFYSRLVALSAQTPVTTDQLFRMVTVIESMGETIDLTSGTSRKFLLSLANAIYILTQGQRLELQLLQETRGLFGATNEQYAVLLRLLKAINPEFENQAKLWRQQGIFQEKVVEYLEAFGLAGQDIQRTFQGITTSWKSFFELAGKEGFGNFYDYITTGLFNLLTKFWEFDEATQTFTGNLTNSGKEVVNAFKKIGDSLVTVIEKLKEANQYLDPILKNASKTIKIAVEFTTSEEVKEGAKTIFGFIKDKALEFWNEIQQSRDRLKKDLATFERKYPEYSSSIMSGYESSPFKATPGSLWEQRFGSFQTVDYLKTQLTETTAQTVTKTKDVLAPFIELNKQVSAAFQQIIQDSKDAKKALNNFTKVLPTNRMQKFLDTLKQGDILLHRYDTQLAKFSTSLQKLGVINKDITIDNIGTVMEKVAQQIGKIKTVLDTNKNLNEQDKEILSAKLTTLQTILKGLLKISSYYNTIKLTQEQLNKLAEIELKIIQLKTVLAKTASEEEKKMLQIQIERLENEKKLIGITDTKLKQSLKQLYDSSYKGQLKQLQDRKFFNIEETKLEIKYQNDLLLAEKAHILIRKNKLELIKLEYNRQRKLLELQKQLKTASPEEAELINQKMQLINEYYNEQIKKITDFNSVIAVKIEDIWSSTFSNLKGVFVDFLTDFKFNMDSITAIFRRAAAEMVVEWITSWIKMKMISAGANLLGSIFGGIGGLFGGATASTATTGSLSTSWDTFNMSLGSFTFHKGGIVGLTSAPVRLVPSSLFENAPRLHSGLAPDEFPAILQKGEIVLPKDTKIRNEEQQAPVIIINAIDVKTFEDYVKRNPGAIITIVNDALKRNTALTQTVRSL